MALRRQTIPITFQGGLSQKSAKELVVPGQLLTSENTVFRKIGRLDKRPGFAPLGKTIIGSSDLIDSGQQITQFQNSAILLGDDTAYTYISAADTWKEVGKISPLSVDIDSYIRNTDTQAIVDSDSRDNITAMVWEDSRGNIRWSVKDESTGSYVIFDSELETGASLPKVAIFDSTIVVAYVSSTNSLKAKEFSRETYQLLSTNTLIGTGVNAQPWAMSRTSSENAVFAYRKASVNYGLGYITKNATLGSATNGLPPPITIVDATFGTVSDIYYDDDRDEVLLLLNRQPSNHLSRLYVYDQFLANLISDEALFSGDNNLQASITPHPVQDIAGSKKYAIFSSILDTTNTVYVANARVISRNLTTDVISTVSTGDDVIGLAMTTKIFSDSKHFYGIFTTDTDIQSTFFIVRDDNTIVGKFRDGLSGGVAKDPVGGIVLSLTSVAELTSGTITTGVQVRNRLTSADGSVLLSGEKGIDQLTIDFDGSKLQSAELGDNLHIAGGLMYAYDGNQLVEHGFLQFPEDIAIAKSGGTGPAAGQYQYAITYEWVDAQGQIHRSAPSIPVTISVNGSEQIDLTLGLLWLTNKANVKVVVYRTDTDGVDVFYRTATLENTPSGSTYRRAYADDNSTFSTTNEILYITGAVLDNIATPSATLVHSHVNRLFAAGLPNPNEVRYSKEYVSQEGVAFSDVLTLQIDPTGGGITALSSLDDKMVIFKERAIYAFIGRGPNNLGAQNDFSVPELVSGDIGCINPDSVLVIPQGVMFQSHKGIYLLGRDLSTVEIGAGVADLSSGDITSATLIKDENEARFTTSSGAALIYSYDFGQWATFDNHAATGATYAVNSYLHLKSDGTVNQESLTTFTDNGSDYSLTLETGWFSFAGLQGFQRIYQVALLGQWYSHHILQVEIAYDFEDVYTETIQWNTETGMVQGYYGDDSYYGEDTFYGGEDASSVLQFKIYPARQMCSAIKFRIKDLNNNGGQAYGLINMAFDLGVIGKLNRVALQKIGGAV